MNKRPNEGSKGINLMNILYVQYIEKLTLDNFKVRENGG